MGRSPEYTAPSIQHEGAHPHWHAALRKYRLGALIVAENPHEDAGVQRHRRRLQDHLALDGGVPPVHERRVTAEARLLVQHASSQEGRRVGAEGGERRWSSRVECEL